MNDLISVIVPVYKVEPFLERCINSIIKQTYTNLEIILVDDGSPDRCGEICDNYALKDSRIKTYHQDNGGLSDARNYGVKQSHGAYIAFIDSDDYVSPGYIAYLYGLLDQYHADISCCCMEQTTEDAIIFGVNPDIPDEQVLSGKEACWELFGNLYLVLVTAWGKLYKSEIVHQYPFPVGKKHEDEATTCKYYYTAAKVIVGNRCYYAYYQNPNSIMHTINQDVNRDLIWAQNHRADFFDEHGESKLSRAAWDKLFYYCIYDSLDHNGRCDLYINDLRNQKKLSVRTRLDWTIYHISPLVFKIYLKLVIYPLGKIRERIKYTNKRKTR